MIGIGTLLHELERAWVKSGLNKVTLAARASLHANTLRSLGQRRFNPSVRTIRALQSVLCPGLPKTTFHYGSVRRKNGKDASTAKPKVTP